MKEEEETNDGGTGRNVSNFKCISTIEIERKHKISDNIDVQCTLCTIRNLKFKC